MEAMATRLEAITSRLEAMTHVFRLHSSENAPGRGYGSKVR